MQSSLPRNSAPTLRGSRFQSTLYENASEIFQMTGLLSAMTMTADRVSRRSGDVITGLVKLLLKKAAGENVVEEQDPSPISFVLAQLPSTTRSVLYGTNLDGRTTEYAVCPDCQCTYSRDVDRETGRLIYPRRCSNRPYPGADVCDSQITGTNNQAVKTFLYYDFKDFLASLYTRPDLEKTLDDSADKYWAAHTAGGVFDSTDMVTDIFQGEFFSNLEGPDSASFLARSGEESRLVFSLHVDFFTYNGTSCGTIAMACLNLPPNIRYRAENMYLAGIIPGSKEPQLTQLNHYIRPLVDDLVVTYDPGVFLRTTSLHPSGRLVRCAIGPIVCDLPAGRKLLQLASYTSIHFCSVCTLTYHINLGRSDYPWIERDTAELRLAAEQWRTASSKKVADAILRLFGARFTELWRLPYINPVKQLVVDPTHCLLVGLVPRHFQEVLNLTATASYAQDLISCQFHVFPEDVTGLSENDKKHVTDIHRILIKSTESGGYAELSSKLANKTLKSLVFVCDDLNIRPQSVGRVRKLDWAKTLADWRINQPPVPVSPMARIRAIVRDSTVPSWMKKSSGIKNFSKTLQVHEWKQLCTIYIPIGLISLWGVATNHSSGLIADRHLQVLKHTMSLVAAVRLVSQCYTNKECAERYLEKITDYVRELRVVHPEATHAPNHHMAIHIYDFLRLFGPAQSWCTFPFEQMTSHLKTLITNDQVEQSILKTYIRAGKLHRWLGRPGNSEAVLKVRELFDKFSPSAFAIDNTKLSGSNYEAFWVPVGIPSDLRVLVGRRGVKQMHARHVFNSVVYANSLTHPGDSQIFFQHHDNNVTQPVPGLIKYIYQLHNDDWRFAVLPILPCRAGDVDQFAIYEDFSAKRYSNELGALEIIETSRVRSQFLQWKEDEDHVVIIPVTPYEM